MNKENSLIVVKEYYQNNTLSINYVW